MMITFLVGVPCGYVVALIAIYIMRGRLFVDNRRPYKPPAIELEFMISPNGANHHDQP